MGIPTHGGRPEQAQSTGLPPVALACTTGYCVVVCRHVVSVHVQTDQTKKNMAGPAKERKVVRCACSILYWVSVIRVFTIYNIWTYLSRESASYWSSPRKVRHHCVQLLIKVDQYCSIRWRKGEKCQMRVGSGYWQKPAKLYIEGLFLLATISMVITKR